MLPTMPGATLGLVLAVCALVGTAGAQCVLRGCTSHAQCAGCIAESVVGHTLWEEHDASHFCIFSAAIGNKTCVLEPAFLDADVITECNSPTTESCCIHDSTDAQIGIARCGSKRCRKPIRCEPAGFCVYDEATAVLKGCCIEDDDCPSALAKDYDPDDDDDALTIVTELNDPLLFHCGEYECLSGNCNIKMRESCCNSTANCFSEFGFILPFTSQTLQCIIDPNNPAIGGCNLSFEPGSPCSEDIDCGGDGVANQCATGRCVSGVCHFAPRGAGEIAGCCDASDVSACETPDECLEFEECDVTSSTLDLFPSGSQTIQPTFKCRYRDRRAFGCCTSNADCEDFSDLSRCAAKTCNLLTNQCNLLDNNPDNGWPCAIFSADCGIPNTNNLCEFLESTGGTLDDDDGPVADSYRCEPRTVTTCPPSPTADGLVPPELFVVALSPPDCDWTRGTPGANRIRQSFRITNPVGDQRPLYRFDLIVSAASTSGGVQAIQEITLVDIEVVVASPSNTPFPRPVPDDNFIAFSPIISGSSYEQKFTPQEDVQIYPGETIDVEIEVAFEGSLTLTGISYQLQVQKIELCFPYFYGAPGAPDCNGPADNGKQITRDLDASATQNIDLTSFVCSEQCIDTPTPAPSLAPTPPPTESPPTAPPPPPPPVPTPDDGLPPPPGACAMTNTTRLSTMGVTASLVHCQWDCDDLLDGSVNRITVLLRQRNFEFANLTAFRAIQIIPTFLVAQLPVQLVANITVSANNGEYAGVRTTADDALAFAGISSTSLETILNEGPNATQIPPDGMLDLYVSALIPGNTPDIIDMEGFSITLRLIQEDFLCTQFDADEGFCPQSAVGSTADLQLYMNLDGVLFDDEPCKCSRPCESRHSTQPECGTDISFDCTWDCADRTEASGVRNLLRVENCLSHDGATGSLPIRIDFIAAQVRDSGEFPLDQARLLFRGGEYASVIADPGAIVSETDPFASDLLFFQLPETIVMRPGDEPMCWAIGFEYDEETFAVAGQAMVTTYALAVSACSILEIESGSCINPNSFTDTFEVAGTISLADAFNANDFGQFTIANDTGGYLNLNLLIGDKVDTITIPATDCSEFCGCAPTTGPLPDTGDDDDDNNVALLECELDGCDTCQATQLGDQADACAVLCESIPGAVYRDVRLAKRISNRESPEEQGARYTDEASFDVEVTPVAGASFECIEPREITTGEPLRLLEVRRPSGAPITLPARASYAYPPLAPGASGEALMAFSVCFSPGSAQRLNVSMTTYSDRCVDRVRQWSSCADETIDISDCYQERLVDAGSECAECPVATTTPSATATHGPPGANTALVPTIELAREEKFCVSRRRIDSFLCEDSQTAYDACVSSEANRTVLVASARVALPAAAPIAQSDPGTLRVTLERRMPGPLLAFCRAQYDPQLKLVVRNSAGAVVDNNGAAKVIESDVVDNARAVVDVAYAPLKPGESVELSIRALECAGAAPLDYAASAQLISASCYDAELCTVESEYAGPVLGLNETADGCVPLSHLPKFAFAWCRTPGKHAVEAYEHIMIGGGAGSGPSETTLIVIGVVASLIVVGLCVLFVTLSRRRRRRGAAATRGSGRRRRVKSVRF